MDREKIEINFGFPIATVMFLIFLVLKLIGKIDWSWWWVTSPLWIPLVIALIAVIVFFIFFKGK